MSFCRRSRSCRTAGQWSPRFSAASLRGALLLIHGEIDDNVHLANTTQFAYELQRAQKPFQLMVYPKSRHGVLLQALKDAIVEVIRKRLTSS